MKTKNNKNNQLLYSQLTYEIRGACFDLRKELGWGHKEVVYQRGLAEKLKKRGIKLERERKFPVKVEGKVVGYYVPDIIVEDKVMLEIKAKELLTKQDVKQFWHYLRITPYKLGLLINFGNRSELQIKRVIYDQARFRAFPRNSAHYSATIRGKSSKNSQCNQ